MLYIADTNNNRIRKVDLSGIISTVAGTGDTSPVILGGVATNVPISGPKGLAVDSAGNLFLTDANGFLREVTNGIVSVLAGFDVGEEFSGLTVDASDNLYYGELLWRQILRRTPLGVYDAVGTLGSLFSVPPNTVLTTFGALAADSLGNVYLTSANIFGAIDLADIVVKIAGGIPNGAPSILESQATIPSLATPTGVAAGPNGTLYIADQYARRVYLIRFPYITAALTHSGTLTTGDAADVFQITITAGGTQSTSGTVTANLAFAPGFTILALAGTGWTCDISATTCTRADVLSPGQSYPPINALAYVSAKAAASVTNTVHLSGGSANESSATDVATVVQKPASATLPNSVFVRLLFNDLLGRPADDAGLAYWTNQLNSGALTQAQTASQFFASQEFSQSGLYVIKLYLAIFQRDPDFAGWHYWFNALTTGTPSTSALAAFLTSNEFTSLYGNLDNTAFVNLVYQNVLGRAPDSAGLAYWVGQVSAVGRPAVMNQFIRSAEYDTKVRARACADLLYMGFLRRDPDPNGAAYWSGVLADPAALPGAIATFIGSSEYRARF